MRVFIDLDGVCADFIGGLEAKGLTDVNIPWDNLDEQFWATLPILPGAIEAVSQIALTRDYYFLSGPTRHHGSYSGKARWIRTFLYLAGIKNHIVEAHHRLILCYANNKFLLARNHSDLLIDDNPKNYHDWAKAGGTSILHENWDETMSLL